MARGLRLAVSYAYVERPNTRRNLSFFLRHGLDSSVALLSIVVKIGRPSDHAGDGGGSGCGFSLDIPKEHRERVRVTVAENTGYDMESHRRNALLFATLEEEEAQRQRETETEDGGDPLFTHFVAMNDSAMGPFCRGDPAARAAEGAAEEEEVDEEEPGPGPWHRLFA